MAFTGLYDPRNDLPSDYPFEILKHSLTDPVRLRASGERARKRNLLNGIGQAAIQFGLADAYPHEELTSAVIGMDLYAVMTDRGALVDGLREVEQMYSSPTGMGIIETVSHKFLTMHPSDAKDVVVVADDAVHMQTPRLSGWLDSAISELVVSEPSLKLDALRMRRGATLLALMHMYAADQGGVPTRSVLS